MISDIIKTKRLVVITGGAGSGKTTMATNICNELAISYYSLDYSFIGDSEYRRNLLAYKSSSLDEYIDASNQFNWWNWDKIAADITTLKMGTSISMSAYDRDSGTYKYTTINPSPILIVEGAVLNYWLCSQADLIIYKYSDEEKRFFRLLDKDRERRTFNEIVNRWLVTTYSETLSYKMMFEYFRQNIIAVDDNYDIIDNFHYDIIKTYIPYPV